MNTRIVLWLAVTLLIGSSAPAQEKGAVGLTMAYPASVGVVWQLSDRIALRPDVAVSGSSTEFSTDLEDGLASSSEVWSVGLGLSALFTVQRWDRLSAYVSPRFAWSRGKSTSQAGSPSTSFGRTLTGYSIRGSFGTQYALSERFGAFGEAGLEYARQELSSPSAPSLTSTSHSWGSKAGVGLVFFF